MNIDHLLSELKPKKIANMEYRIEVDSSKGMKVPVTIYADDSLIQKMMTDRTIKQAMLLPWMQKKA